MVATNGDVEVNGDGAPSNLAPFISKRVEGYHEFLPNQPYPVGSLLPSDKFPQNASPPKLFEPLVIRGTTFHNRLAVSPMCMCEYHAFDAWDPC